MFRPADSILDYELYRHISKKVERRKTEVGSRNAEVGKRKGEGGRWKTEVGMRKWESGSGKGEGGRGSGGVYPHPEFGACLRQAIS